MLLFDASLGAHKNLRQLSTLNLNDVKLIIMFPRPSRFLRMLIFVSVFIFLIISMYIFTSKFGDQQKVNSMYERHYKLSTFEDICGFSKSHQDVDPSNSSNNEKDQTPVLQTIHEVSFDKQVQMKLENHQTSKHDKFSFEFTGQIVNPHSFSYIHNPVSLCRSPTVRFLIYIHSSPNNLKKRQAIRQTWGQPKILLLYKAFMVFILGRATDPAVQELVDMEAAHYGDIVQEDFVDSYRNLTYKGVAGLKWASLFCNQSDFLLKTDDDILIDIVTLIEDLYTRVIPIRHSTGRLVLCNLWTRMKVIRDPKSKWFISREEFSGEYFPPYCSGSAFLLSSELAPALYTAALHTPFFWVDDYYITGLLVSKLRVQHTRYNTAYSLNYNNAEEKLKNNSRELIVFHTKKLNVFLKLWPVIVQRHEGMDAYLQQIPISTFSKGRSAKAKTSVTGCIQKKEYLPQTTLNGPKSGPSYGFST
ncbi:beta-1,3-galactosyltransferase 1-like [Physella acuta]|uniref:beta-1,3-galactosyltransferase 1-like n=1 Tax=Physella acuta TaxID=109671 RepID=UPI0027DDA64A|nr:beta-1,3-galactosyltransferase 1-like [Physella acuta]